jgi:hypothetical protein
MDFKDIINKVAELNDEVEYVKAPELEKAPQLNEDQELRMLAGLKPLTETEDKEIVAEAKEVVAELDNMQTGEKKKSATGGTIEKTATGYKHHGKKYGGSADDEEKDKDDDMDEAVEAEEEVVDEASEAQKKAREKFMAMVKSKKEKKEESVKEAKKAKPDFLDMDKDGDKKEPMKKALKDKKTDEAMCKSKKKMKEEIKESADDVLSFREMAKLVKESGGQQRIDATDTALWTWAKRVAGNKFEDKTRQEVYAGLVYERMGGHFDMVDVLAEQQD